MPLAHPDGQLALAGGQICPASSFRGLLVSVFCLLARPTASPDALYPMGMLLRLSQG